MTRSANSWKTLPGGFDTVNAFWDPDESGKHGIPVIKRDRDFSPPKFIAPYRQRIRSEDAKDRGAVHFFLDDYRFESVWGHPNKAFKAVLASGMALSPDFSLWWDAPEAVQIWNTYRNRWCGAWWQARGIIVVPTITWAGESTFEFCFEGVEKGSEVAVSTVGLSAQGAAGFSAGYTAMIEALEPSTVLCYGELPPTLWPLAEVIEYPTRWEGIRKALKG